MGDREQWKGKPKRLMGSTSEAVGKLDEAHLALHGPVKSGLGFVW